MTPENILSVRYFFTGRSLPTHVNNGRNNVQFSFVQKQSDHSLPLWNLSLSQIYVPEIYSKNMVTKVTNDRSVFANQCLAVSISLTVCMCLDWIVSFPCERFTKFIRGKNKSNKVMEFTTPKRRFGSRVLTSSCDFPRSAEPHGGLASPASASEAQRDLRLAIGKTLLIIKTHGHVYYSRGKGSREVKTRHGFQICVFANEHIPGAKRINDLNVERVERTNFVCRAKENQWFKCWRELSQMSGNQARWVEMPPLQDPRDGSLKSNCFPDEWKRFL